MNNAPKFFIRPFIIVLSFDPLLGKSYILSLDKDSVEPINYFVDCLEQVRHDNYPIEQIKKYANIATIEIGMNLVDLHCIEIEKFYQTNDIIYPLYGANIPMISSLNNAYWKEYSILEPNNFSYSITRVLQNSIL